MVGPAPMSFFYLQYLHITMYTFLGVHNPAALPFVALLPGNRTGLQRPQQGNGGHAWLNFWVFG